MLLIILILLVSQYFTLKEFASPDNAPMPPLAQKNITEIVIPGLTFIRKNTGIPMIITSGYRSPEHNAKVGGVKNSEHTLGLAADVAVKNAIMRYKFIKYALAYPITRIGVYNTFLHFGFSTEHPQNVIWTSIE
ncbi:MAG: D-Ala-D-Ala carboxypeptidase family metallohydrolase [candidate division WOR-3 bacterium]